MVVLDWRRGGRVGGGGGRKAVGGMAGKGE